MADVEEEHKACAIGGAKILDGPGEFCRIERLSDGVGPGNILILEAKFKHVTEIVGGFGKLGVSAQSARDKAAKRMAGYLASEAFAGPYLGDQLLSPMALACAGFLDVSVSFDEQANGPHIVSVAAA